MGRWQHDRFVSEVRVEGIDENRVWRVALELRAAGPEHERSRGSRRGGEVVEQ